jgi:hypothetical protein
MDTGFSSASGNIENVIISGNTFSTNTAQNDSISAIKCDQSLINKVSNVVIGPNSYNGYVPVNGDQSEGRLDMNCTPDAVKDADTAYIWLPAGGCNGSTAYPVYDLPTSSAPTPFCNGSNQPRGFLAFPDAVDTYAYTTFTIPATSTYQFFVRPIFSVNASNNNSTRWGFTLRCSGNDDPADSSWSETEYTLDTTLGSVAAMDLRVVSASYSNINYAACAKEMVTLRVHRIGGNASDTQANDTYLYGLQVWARRQS